MAEGPASGLSQGGMTTKLAAAKIALDAGCHMAIANGRNAHALARLAQGGVASWFIARETPQQARKHWIASAMHLSGQLVIDAGAATALAQGRSLLPAGVVAVEGRFDRGDTVGIADLQGHLLAKGISGFTSAEAHAIRGQKTDALTAILGYATRDPLIHRDDLAML